MKPRVDVHCHFINFNYLPDKYTTHLLANKSKILAKIMHEDDFRTPNAFETSILKLAKLAGVKYIDKFLNSLRVSNFWGEGGVIDNLIKSGEYFTYSDYKNASNYSNIKLYTPLMMDFITSAHISNIKSKDGVVPFLLQWYEHILIARSHPWKVMPFFHFHPERKHIVEICKEAINDFGFIGIKMYPAMGFYPDCYHDENKQVVNNNLKGLYSFLRKLRNDGIVIPITAHSQFSSTQSIYMSMSETMKFTDISNWERPIEEYNLKINFAHYGGNEYLENNSNEIIDFSTKSRTKIRQLMEKYNKNDTKRIFADTAAHSGPFGKHSNKYFENLKNDLDSDIYPIMFGTDMPVINADIMIKDYINAFEDGINDDQKLQKFFTDNALDFLFEKRLIPDHYIEFLEISKKCGFIDNDPLGKDLIKWVERTDDGKYRVTT